MTRGLIFSKALAAAAAAALIAASATYWVRAAAKTDLVAQRRQAATAERELRTRVDAMAAYESENLDSLRRQVGRFRTHLGTESTWDGLVRALGSGWSAEIGPRDDRGAYSIQLGTLTLVSHAVGEWPGIVDALGQLEAMPGVGIAEFEMKTSGSSDSRTLDTARMGVVIQTTRAVLNPKITP